MNITEIETELENVIRYFFEQNKVNIDFNEIVKATGRENKQEALRCIDLMINSEYVTKYTDGEYQSYELTAKARDYYYAKDKTEDIF